MTVAYETALGIARAYREIEEAEGLLEQVRKGMAEDHTQEDIRDAFGRRRRALQLGIPSGSNNSHRLMDVAFELALPIIETHIAHSRARVAALSVKARAEAASAMSAFGQDPQGLEAKPASAVPQADAQPNP